MTASALREPWSDLSRQREAAIFGMWVFLASELLFFSGLFLSYAIARFLHPIGFLHGIRETNVWFGTINTIVLVSSSFAMALAAQAGDARRRRLALTCLEATLLLGLTFLIIKGFEYREDIEKGLWPGPAFPLPRQGAELFFALYWVMTGVHAIHLTVGVTLIVRLTWVAGRRELPLTSPELQVTTLYWHLIDIIWIVLYPLLYLGGRS